jgi:hypothetical protein
VFENRLLRRIFGPKRDEVTGEWRKLRNEELNDLCSTPNIIRVKKNREKRDGWGMSYEGKSPFEDPGVQGRLLRRIFKKWDKGHGLD